MAIAVATASTIPISFEIIEFKKFKYQNKLFDIEELETILSTYNNTGFWIGKDEYNNIELFEKNFWELEKKQTGYVFNIKSLCTQIIVNAARCCMSKNESSNTVPVKISDDKRRFILDFYFGECYKSLTLSELAEKLNVSQRQLNRIIKTFYNTTFKEKLISIKIQNAVHLLQTTTMTAEEIAEAVGFSSPSYFFRVFKKHCKMSPMQYKA